MHRYFQPSVESISVSAYRPDRGLLPDFPGDSLYVEEVYASIAGPTALVCYRRLLRLVADNREPFRVEVDDLGASLGVKRDVTLRSLERLVRFRFAHLAELPAHEQDSWLVIHTRIPIVDAYHFERLSRTVRSEHYRLVRQLRATG